MNTQRILAAAEWAEANIDPKMFDMKDYRKNKDFKNPICDSVGCMVGHLTTIDAKNVKENYLKKNGFINFQIWSKDYFELNDIEWIYLFSKFWAYYDNTLQGAIARMRRLANGMTEDEIKIEFEKI